MTRRTTLALPSALEIKPTDGRGILARSVSSVFLDYDGTLTPIVSRPELAILSDEMRAMVKRLAARYPVTIVSGRDVAVLAELMAIDEIGYVGSHGLDIIGPLGSGLRKEVAMEFLPALDAVEINLRLKTCNIKGVVIERKRFSISIHVRLVEPAERQRVESVVGPLRSAYPSLRSERGKMLIELRPDIEWDKGAAVQWLIGEMGLDASAALFVGDDLTDESVFRVLAGQGIGIVVADTDRPTNACSRLRDPDEVQQLLDRLISRGVLA